MVAKIEISQTVYNYFSKNIKLNATNKNCFYFILEKNLAFKRYFVDLTYNAIVPDTFYIRIKKSNRKKYFILENSVLKAKNSNERFYFCYKFMKKRVL